MDTSIPQFNLPAKIVEDEFRAPEHRLTLQISDHKVKAWLLRRICSNNESKRDTLVFTNPRDVVGLLDEGIQAKWKAYSREVKNYQSRWEFMDVPILKRIVRKYRERSAFQYYDLATTIHHFGAVPALVVGSVAEYQIALVEEALGYVGSRRKYNDDEYWEILNSLDKFLPLLLHAYYEQISFYFRSVFFAATSAQKVMAFCLRIRQIAMGSIRPKLESIEECPAELKNSHSLARLLKEKYKKELREGHAVDAFAHLLVNYIYRFYCLRDRVPDYAGRLSKIQSSRDLFDSDPVSFIQSCAQNLERPSIEFLEKLKGEWLAQRDDWLKTLGQASAFASEIVAANQKNGFDVPKVFVTRHYKIPDSDQFERILSDALRLNQATLDLMTGRYLGRDIRWSLLARVWICDHHVLFLPSSWTRIDGKAKALRRRKNWVIIELLYSRALNLDMSLVVAAPTSEAVLDDFVSNINDYTNEIEIPEVPKVGWSSLVDRAKAELTDLIHTIQRLPCKLDDPANGEFWTRFDQQVVKKASRRFVRVLFQAWCYFFEARAWSVVQALLLMSRKQKRNAYKVKDIAEFIMSQPRSDERFGWAKQYTSLDVLASDVRDVCLGKVRDFGSLRNFALKIGGSLLYPLVVNKNGTSLDISLRTEELFKALCKRFDISESPENLALIEQELLSPRRE